MPRGCFVDTNVLLYAQDRRAPEKQSRSSEWLAALAAHDLLVISPQVMNEFTHTVLRKMAHVTPDDLIVVLEEMRRWCSAATSTETAINGLIVHRRYGFSFYDSTLLASALLAGCEMFLSEDLSDRQRVGDLRIINPFASAPDAVLKS